MFGPAQEYSCDSYRLRGEGSATRPWLARGGGDVLLHRSRAEPGLSAGRRVLGRWRGSLLDLARRGHR